MDFAKYSSIPYENKGRSEKGFDCWGLVRLFYLNEKGIELPSYVEEYETCSNASGAIKENMGAEWNRTDIPEPGDVALFRIRGYPSHVGLMIDNRRFMHVLKGVGVVIEELDSLLWTKRLQGVYHYG